jgi:hypothetical protein
MYYRRSSPAPNARTQPRDQLVPSSFKQKDSSEPLLVDVLTLPDRRLAVLIYGIVLHECARPDDGAGDRSPRISTPRRREGAAAAEAES